MTTMGPSIHDVDILSQMLEAGMVSGRVDLTWGPLEFHRNSLSFLQVSRGSIRVAAGHLYSMSPIITFGRASHQPMQEAMKRTRRLCATVIDTMGRELMIRGQVFGMGRGGVEGGYSVSPNPGDPISSHPPCVPFAHHSGKPMTKGTLGYSAEMRLRWARRSSSPPARMPLPRRGKEGGHSGSPLCLEEDERGYWIFLKEFH